MIEHVLDHDPSREIVVTLHPKETYSLQELSALDALQARLSSSEPATMDDVYWTVSFLLDERSQLVTGQVMYLGGP